MKPNKPIHRSLLALAALATAPAAMASLITTDTTVNTGTTGESNSQVVTKWTTAQGSAPVDTVNDLLINHATASMSAGGGALGDSLSAINDGLMLSGGHTSSQTDGMCLFTSDGHWTGSGPADLVFTLDAHYDIARIDSFTLWDPSRTGQTYDLYGSTDGGASWTFITSVNKDSGAEGSNRDLRRISLTNAGGVIPGLAGVNALKFHIMDPGPNGATSNNSIYAEIAAYAVTSVSDYSTWAANPAYAGFDLSNPAADPDGDGLNNQQEYAFGLDPTKGSSVSPCTPLLGTQFSYTRRATSGLAYTVEYSTNLSTWNPASVTELPGDPDSNGVQTVAVTVNNAPVGGKLFVRVQAQ
jgi:hypothetical protein